MSAPTKKRPPLSVQRLQVAGLCVALAAITFAVFGQTLTHAFVNFDDNDYVFDNPVVARGLTLKGMAWAFTGAHASNWHPLTWLSHELDCQLYGLNPAGHHLTNVLLHIATVIALFLVLRQMTGALWRSAFVAAVFAIHPLRAESVAWVSERKDVLSGLFFMLTLWAYVCYARQPGSWGRYGLVMLLFAMGLMSKPMLVTLPLVLLLLDYWPLRRKESAGRLALEKLPLLALSAASCMVTLLAQHKAYSDEFLPLPLRCANALAACAVYLGQMAWPAGLAVYYPYPVKGYPAGTLAVVILLLALITGGVLALRRKQPWLLTGWFWYLAMLLPVLGVIQVGGQAHADRYTYLPQIGIYVAVTWLAAEWRVSRAVFAGLMAGVIAVLMVCAWKQAGYWKSSETLWQHALDCTTDNAMAHMNLGMALLEKGKVDEAISQNQEALRINPGYMSTHNNLGNALMRKGRVDEAITQYQEVLRLKPDNATACYNLGLALDKKGRMDEAIAEYQKALQIKPDYAEADYSLGRAFLQMGRTDEAIALFQQSLQIKPDAPNVHNNLGVALFRKGKVDEAIGHFQNALRLDPDFPEAHNNLGSIFLQIGRVEEAIAEFQKTVEIKPGDAEASGHLAAALAAAGRFDEARSMTEKAIELARAAGREDLAARFNEELKRYQTGLPMHR